MFLAIKEMKHSKTRFAMIGTIIMLIAWLVFILSGLGNGLSTLAAATMKNIDGDLFIYEEGSEGTMMKTKVSGTIADDIEGKYGLEVVGVTKGETFNHLPTVFVMQSKP